jgi:hypothetical protein
MLCVDCSKLTVYCDWAVSNRFATLQQLTRSRGTNLPRSNY